MFSCHQLAHLFPSENQIVWIEIYVKIEEVKEYIHPKFQVQEYFECIPTVQKPKEIVDVENIKLKSNDYNIKEVWNIHLNFVLDSAKKMWP